MTTLAPPALLLAAALSLIGAACHFACIPWGANGYRFFGAGERLAVMAERGHWAPAVVASAIGMVLMAWAAFALSAAGILPRLPFTKLALPAIAAVLLLRAVAFPLLKPAFPGNSQAFWWVSSGVCLVMGLAFLVGTVGRWAVL